MAQQAGWAEQGGRLLMDADGNVTGRTPWQAKYQWYQGLPPEARLSDKATNEAVEMAIAGKPLTMPQRTAVNAMLDVLRTYDAINNPNYQYTADEEAFLERNAVQHENAPIDDVDYLDGIDIPLPEFNQSPYDGQRNQPTTDSTAGTAQPPINPGSGLADIQGDGYSATDATATQPGAIDSVLANNAGTSAGQRPEQTGFTDDATLNAAPVGNDGYGNGTPTGNDFAPASGLGTDALGLPSDGIGDATRTGADSGNGTANGGFVDQQPVEQNRGSVDAQRTNGQEAATSATESESELIETDLSNDELSGLSNVRKMPTKKQPPMPMPKPGKGKKGC